MQGSNTPTEFILTPENLLDTLLEWLPGQLEEMRLYRAGAIKIDMGYLTSLECQYMQTIGGEKFRIVEKTPRGDSGSHYLEPLGADDDIILAYARRIEEDFNSTKKFNDRFYKDNPKPVELKMVFTPGPFDKLVAPAVANTEKETDTSMSDISSGTVYL